MMNEASRSKSEWLKNKADFYSGLFLAAFSLAFCLMAYKVGLGDFRQPGTGLFPFVTAFLLCLMSIGLFVKNLLGEVEISLEKASNRINWKTVGMVLPILVFYGVILKTVGFSVSSFLLMIFLFGIVGRKRWWVAMVISLITVLSSYLIFIVWLRCSFPEGLLGI